MHTRQPIQKKVGVVLPQNFPLLVLDLAGKMLEPELQLM